MANPPTARVCLASNDEDFDTLAECTRRQGHANHHCDTRNQRAWGSDGPTQCETGYDHGQPPNRQARRGTVTHPTRAQRRIRKGNPR